MGPRFRGDDSGECCPSQLANASPPGGFIFFGAGRRLRAPPVKVRGAERRKAHLVPHLAIGAASHACEAWRIPCDRRQVYAVCANKLPGMLASRRSTGGVLVSATGRAFAGYT